MCYASVLTLGFVRLTARDHIALNVLAQTHQVALGFGLGHATVWGEDPGRTTSHECCQKTREQSWPVLAGITLQSKEHQEITWCLRACG